MYYNILGEKFDFRGFFLKIRILFFRIQFQIQMKPGSDLIGINNPCLRARNFRLLDSGSKIV